MDSSGWTVQTHTTTTRAKRSYTKHMRCKGTCARNQKMHKDSERVSKKYCHYTTIQVVPATINCQNGIQPCILAEQLLTQRWCTPNNKLKNNTDRKKTYVQQNLEHMSKPIKNITTPWNQRHRGL